MSVRHSSSASGFPHPTAPAHVRNASVMASAGLISVQAHAPDLFRGLRGAHAADGLVRDAASDALLPGFALEGLLRLADLLGDLGGSGRGRFLHLPLPESAAALVPFPL